MYMTKETRRVKRHKGIRKRIFGTSERPRLSVHRSAKNIYVQVIDDTQGKTLYSFSSQDKAFSKEKPKAGKVTAAKKLGQFFSKNLKEKGIEKVAFDRSGYKYHGRIKALADSLREAGIQF